MVLFRDGHFKVPNNPIKRHRHVAFLRLSHVRHCAKPVLIWRLYDGLPHYFCPTCYINRCIFTNHHPSIHVQYLTIINHVVSYYVTRLYPATFISVENGTKLTWIIYKYIWNFGIAISHWKISVFSCYNICVLDSYVDITTINRDHEAQLYTTWLINTVGSLWAIAKAKHSIMGRSLLLCMMPTDVNWTESLLVI